MLPLARALAAAGHEVLVATTPALASVFAEDDLTVNVCLPELEPAALTDDSESADRSATTDGSAGATAGDPMAPLLRRMAVGLTGPMLTTIREHVAPLAQKFRPDLLLRDGMDLHAVLLAEELGVPQFAIPSGVVNIFPPEGLLPGLNAQRAKLGLPTQTDPLSLFPHGRLDYVPAEFSFAGNDAPLRSYRQTLVDRSPVLPEWVAELPTDRPLLFAAIGTALPMVTEQLKDRARGSAGLPDFPDPADVLRSMVAGVSMLRECTVIVATAGVPMEGVEVPEHVHLTERLPQPLLLEAVDLFVTHGGFNSIRESLRSATPMAVLPAFGDQMHNARRVEELGLGREITDRTPEGIAKVCRDVIADPAITARARQARLAMLALPELDSAVTDLEKLVG
ncbi:glycosyltransferase [Allostreptomyces psammosilenae]|uniref:N-glycosyltransferase n=1 Tax=Allostreptomyces psammosilenae TaxID=1892865 RepID=A0A852ZTW1_9ACTN|nr:glycosyltransferase [Allostreptomyces psammosilenae]NYI05305.1 N-glycosyltransferase [Allostreptomyces psammosilenae]